MPLTSRRTVMGRKRYKPQEIVAKLRQVDVLVSQGQNMVDATSLIVERRSASTRSRFSSPGTPKICCTPCPFRKLYPNVVVVQPGQDWDGNYDAGPLDCPTQRRVFSQGQVRAHQIVIRPIRRKNLSQVCLPKDQHPIEALAPHGANQALHI